eukprot:scaffold5160_cov107-Isochrysis_galbana.AAC.6
MRPRALLQLSGGGAQPELHLLHVTRLHLGCGGRLGRGHHASQYGRRSVHHHLDRSPAFQNIQPRQRWSRRTFPAHPFSLQDERLPRPDAQCGAEAAGLGPGERLHQVGGKDGVGQRRLADDAGGIPERVVRRFEARHSHRLQSGARQVGRGHLQLL